MPIVSTPLVCRLTINRGLNGWSERWPLSTWDFGLGLNHAQRLARARANILAANAVIEWAVVAQNFSPWAEQAAITDTLGSLPQWDVDTTDGTGLLWRFETDTGKWANHLFRAIDRAEISGHAWFRAPFYLPAAIPDLPADLTMATKEELLANCFTTFRELTAFHNFLGDTGGGVPQWSIEPWALADYRAVSSRDVGRAYKRVSWEAQFWSSAPAFTPCGEIVGVLRSCYLADCNFYSGAPSNRISYYWARGDAVVFPLPHIFWGRARGKEIANITGPGEVTGPLHRYWTNGEEIGGALGDHFTGTPADFLGSTPIPWIPATPTPSALRPACDMPLGLLAMYWGGDYWGHDYFGQDFMM
jgi:hypothetical protein